MLCLALLTAVTFWLSFSRIEATQATITVNNCVLGADTASFARAMAEGQYRAFKPRKHPLAVGMVAALARPPMMFGVAPATAGSIALALIQAMGAGFFFLFLRRHFLGSVQAALTVALFLSTFGTVTIFGVVETYGTTFMAIALGCLLFGLVGRHTGNAPWMTGVVAGLTGATIGWANPPAIAFLLIYTGFAWSYVGGGLPRKVGVAVLLPGAFACLGTLLPPIMFDPSGGLEWQKQYVQRYASFSNFSDLATVRDYLANFFVFSFVAPLDHVQCRFPATDLAHMLRDPARVTAIVAMHAVCLFGLLRAMRGETRHHALASLGVMGALFLFYLFFNPDEALLYSSQWTLAYVLACAPGFCFGLRGIAALSAVIALALKVNVPPLLHPLTINPLTCCPHRPATMLDREVPALRQPAASEPQ